VNNSLSCYRRFGFKTADRKHSWHGKWFLCQYVVISIVRQGFISNMWLGHGSISQRLVPQKGWSVAPDGIYCLSWVINCFKQPHFQNVKWWLRVNRKSVCSCGHRTHFTSPVGHALQLNLACTALTLSAISALYKSCQCGHSPADNLQSSHRHIQMWMEDN